MASQNRAITPSIADALRKAVSAHMAVRKGIATHAEKKRAEREAARNAKASRDKLAAPLVK